MTLFIFISIGIGIGLIESHTLAAIGIITISALWCKANLSLPSGL